MRKSRDPTILKKNAEIRARTWVIETKNLKKSKEVKWEKLEMFFKFGNVEKKWDAREVWWIASAEIIDTTWDIVLHSAMKDAWVDYIQYGNIREMHQPSAVWTIIESKFDDEEKSTFIKVNVVDDNAWEKVKTWVYKWFSIWAMIEDAEWRIVDEKEVFVITKMKLVEISLVDRPANQNSNIDGFKFISLTNNNMSKWFLEKFMSGKKDVEKSADEEVKTDVEETQEKEEETTEEETDEPTETTETTPEWDKVEKSADADEEEKEEEWDDNEEEEKEEKEEESEEEEDKEETVEVSKKSLDALLEKVNSLEAGIEKVLAFNEKLIKGLDATFAKSFEKVDEMNKSLKVLSTSKRSVQKDIAPKSLNKAGEVSFQNIFGNWGSM